MTSRAVPLISAGLATLTFAAALSQFVLIGLLGVALLPVAFCLLVAAGAAVHRAETPHPLASILTSSTGAGILTYTAFRAGSLSYAVAIHRIHPGTIQERATVAAWLLSFVLSLIGSALFIGALSHGADWSQAHRTRWFFAAAAVFPLTVALFFALAPFFPYTA